MTDDRKEAEARGGRQDDEEIHMESKEPRRGLLPRDPRFRRLLDLQTEIGRWWDRDWWPWPVSHFGPRGGAWAPRIDMYEEGQELVVKAELPGVRREDIELEMIEGDLVIKGERRAERETKEENYYHLEREHGTFYRRLPLPVKADAERARASFTNGVLEVRVARAPEGTAKARKVEVDA